MDELTVLLPPSPISGNGHLWYHWTMYLQAYSIMLAGSGNMLNNTLSQQQNYPYPLSHRWPPMHVILLPMHVIPIGKSWLVHMYPPMYMWIDEYSFNTVVRCESLDMIEFCMRKVLPLLFYYLLGVIAYFRLNFTSSMFRWYCYNQVVITYPSRVRVY